MSLKARQLMTVKALFAALACVLTSPLASMAYGESDVMTSLRTPLIYGTPNTPAYVTPMQGDAPPVGSGYIPMPVTPGSCGMPEAPASHITNLPYAMGGDKDTINAAVSGYLTPPPSTAGYDDGSINGSSGGNGFMAPVCQVPICPQGGMVGNAPTQRWGGQRSYDFGNPNNVRAQSSRMMDYGAKLSEKPDLKMCPQFSEDGPRRSGGQAINGRNLPNAQATQDLYGNRTLFKGSNLRSQATIAPY